MKRIVFINRFYRPDHSATAQLLTDLAQTLAADGRDVSIVTSRQTYDNPNSKLPAYEVIDGVKVHRIWTSRFGRARLLGRAIDYLSFYLSALVHLLAHLRRNDIVIAKTDPPLISVIAAIAAKIRGAQLINWLQDVFPEVAGKLRILNESNPLFNLLRRMRDQTLRHATINVAIGELMGNTLRQIAGDPATQIIPNWPIQKKLSPHELHDNPMRRDWGLNEKFIIAYSGNLGRAHEFQTILDAAEKLKNQKNIIFLFIGAGAQLQPVRDFVERKNLENILFKPYQPQQNLACSLAAADVHLVSLQPELEGLIVPSKFYGIIAVGRPIIFIGASQGELGVIIEQQRCGAVIKPGDSDGLVSQVTHWQSQRADFYQCANASAMISKTLFSREHSLRAWKDILV